VISSTYQPQNTGFSTPESYENINVCSYQHYVNNYV